MDLSSGSGIGAIPLLLLAGLAVVVIGAWAISLGWVWRDAERRGKPGIVVALLAGLVCWPVGLLVWLILRGDYSRTQAQAPTPPRACPRCGRALSSDTAHGLCPACLLQQAAVSESGAPNPSAFTPPSVAELAPLFPQLEIIELLGRGGMGAVYKARQPGLDRLVALKVLPAKPGADPAFAERFGREARALAAMNHPHIVNVYDFGQLPTLSYFVMEYVDGVNLRQLQQAARLSPREALAIVPQVCEALQFAHDRGIVHRDIKPENILVDKQGRVKIADFGLAKLIRPEAGGIALTETRHAVGTPQYMAPEQVEKPQSVDHRADIYSLGVVFYEMLTGELPMGRFPVPSQRVQVDVRLDEVVLKALEKEPERRYQQASAFKTNVETVAGTPPVVEGRAPSRPPAAANGHDGAWPSNDVPPTPPRDGSASSVHSSAGQSRLILDSMAGFFALLGVLMGLLMVTNPSVNSTGPVLSMIGCFLQAVSLALYGRWPKKLPAEGMPAKPLSPGLQKVQYAARVGLCVVAVLMVAFAVYALGPHLADPRYLVRLIAVVLLSAGLVFLAVVQRPRTGTNSLPFVVNVILAIAIGVVVFIVAVVAWRLNPG
jgi:serine/threonine protein kinase